MGLLLAAARAAINASFLAPLTNMPMRRLFRAAARTLRPASPSHRRWTL